MISYAGLYFAWMITIMSNEHDHYLISLHHLHHRSQGRCLTTSLPVVILLLIVYVSIVHILAPPPDLRASTDAIVINEDAIVFINMILLYHLRQRS